MKKTFVGIVIAGFVAAMIAMIWYRTTAKDHAQNHEKTSSPSSSSSATATSFDDPQEDAAHTRLTGRVLEPTGTGVENAAVCAWFEHVISGRTELFAPSCVLSASDGTYEIAGLRAGQPFKLSATATNHAPATYMSKSGDPHITLGVDEQRDHVDIVLAGGGVALRGRVKDALGGTIAGANIIVTFNEEHSAIASISDDKGEFVAWVSPGFARVKASAEGYADAFATGDAPEHRFELSLLPSSSIIGRAITRPGGAPVPGAQVEAISLDQGARKSTHAGDDGVFRIDGLPPGRYRLEGLAPGLSGYSPGSVIVGLAETSHEAVVELEKSPPVTARVLDSMSHGPCKGGSVTLHDVRQGEYALGTIEADGAVHFEGVLPGKYGVEVACDDHIRKSKFPDVTVTDRPIGGITWEVDRGSEARGVVVDADGKFVANATVSAEPEEGGTTHTSTHSDARGGFVLRGLDEGKYSITATSIAAGSDASTSVQVDGQRDENGVRVELGRAAKLVGTVVDVDGKPVSGVAVTLYGPTQSNETTHDDGTFVAPGLGAGMYRVVASSEGNRLHFSSEAGEDIGESIQLKVEVGEKLAKKFTVERRAGSLEGRVVDVHNEPLPDFFVDAQRVVKSGRNRRGFSQSQSRVLTDSSGRFRIEGLADGEYTVRGYRQSGAQGVVEHVPVGTTDVNIQIAWGEVAVNVLDAKGARPDRFTIQIYSGKKGVSRSDLAFHTGAAFTMGELPPGNYDISIDSPSGSGAGSAIVTDGAQTPVTITLKPPPEPEVEAP